MTPVRRRMAGLAVALSALAAAGCAVSPPEPSIRPTASYDSVGVVYSDADGEQLDADLCLPEDPRPAGAVVLVHGGAFESGDRTSMAGACDLVASWGLVGMAVDYRLLPEHPYPAQVEDVQAAVEWLRSPAQQEQYGIDPAQVALWGSSAGSIIALSAAENLAGDGQPVAGVVGLSAAGDLTEGGLALGTPAPELQAAVLAYLGCPSVEDCPVAAEASPSTDAASLPPILLVHSERDAIPLAQAEALAAATQDAGGDAELLVVPGSHHGLQLLSSDVRATIERFLDDVI